MGLFEKMFGTYSQRELKRIRPIADAVEALAEEYKALSDADLRGKTAEFKKRYADGETLDQLLPEAFAAMREASERVTGMRPFYVQLIGGIVLHQGRIAEMKTGEGKTLVATLPVYLNALSGKGVHVVTVNDYLARRDSEEMGRIYRYMGLTVGLSVHGMTPEEKREAYNCDITYGTNNEFGFDYLRDNMVLYKEKMVQRGHAFAVVDEVDSILIDEARTPLIISGQGEESTDLYTRANALVRTMKKEVILEQDTKKPIEEYEADYVVDEKAKSAFLTPNGMSKAEKFFSVTNLADGSNSELLHHVNQAIRAYGVMKRDVDYVVREDGVIIVDEFTGRLMFGRRYSNGLHQAIEAKEGVTVEKENKTMATITFQNYFRLYDKLSGMTGTAMTEEEEFRQIYGMDVVEIPTNRPMIREDMQDVIYKTVAGKYNAIIDQIVECYERRQPVLVGTISIEKSELLGRMLKKRGVPFHILNAKYHEREAEIIAQAGRSGAFTIATNMAGRGTDIRLGGNPDYMAKSDMRGMGIAEELIYEASGHAETEDEAILNARRLYQDLYNKHKEACTAEAKAVVEAGGLFILGTERHESRRIDNQLRGRAGRQGDMGYSRFFLSLEDDLMRLFGGDRMRAMMNTLNIDEDMPIENKLLTSMIENAQKKVEDMNFERRKHVLEYDDVINKQRETIYEQRRKVLSGEDIHESIMGMIHSVIADACARFLVGTPDTWNIDGLRHEFLGQFLTPNDLIFEEDALAQLTPADVEQMVVERAQAVFAAREAEFGSEQMRELERVVLLHTVDSKWVEHIDAMDDLKQGISLRSYANVQPVVAYRNEGADMYAQMIDDIRYETVRMIFRVRIAVRQAVGKVTGQSHGEGEKKTVTVKKSAKVGRNDPCPCGSGKKYKQCCGKE